MSQLPVYVIVFPSGRSYIHHPDYLIQEYIFMRKNQCDQQHRIYEIIQQEEPKEKKE